MGIPQALGQLVEGGDEFVQTRPFAAQFLGAFRVVPDLGTLEFAVYFLETLALGVVLKDTPGGQWLCP